MNKSLTFQEKLKERLSREKVDPWAPVWYEVKADRVIRHFSDLYGYKSDCVIKFEQNDTIDTIIEKFMYNKFDETYHTQTSK